LLQKEAVSDALALAMSAQRKASFGSWSYAQAALYTNDRVSSVEIIMFTMGCFTA
jgi:hypothetical protein